MEEKYYKVLAEDGTPHHGGKGKWSLPTADGPGEWMPQIEKIEPCRSGYHVCREQDLIYWLGPAIFEVEIRGTTIVHEEAGSSKVVAAEARLIRRLDTWNDRTARLFAADCAEAVLPIFEKERPNDDRPRKAIQAARDFAEGRTGAAAWAAARDAARDAAGAAARDAAGDAAGDAARDAARAAAWAAARAAAGDAAWAAARAAARAAAGAAQTIRLFQYLRGEA